MEVRCLPETEFRPDFQGLHCDLRSATLHLFRTSGDVRKNSKGNTMQNTSYEMK